MIAGEALDHLENRIVTVWFQDHDFRGNAAYLVHGTLDIVEMMQNAVDDGRIEPVSVVGDAVHICRFKTDLAFIRTIYPFPRGVNGSIRGIDPQDLARLAPEQGKSIGAIAATDVDDLLAFQVHDGKNGGGEAVVGET